MQRNASVTKRPNGKETKRIFDADASIALPALDVCGGCERAINARNRNECNETKLEGSTRGIKK